MELTDLYREVILDHNKHPRNFGRLEPHDAEARGHNPLCGDRLTVTLSRDGDRIADLRFEGNGCAISVASASMMSEAVIGKSRADIDALFQRMHALLTEQGVSSDGLGKLAALSGVREFPARVKCASLCWHTLNAALAQSDAQLAVQQAATVSTE
ncbi:MAG: Fe-S cluster assembly sulfur transfer protein SufU [Steroidobacteraceae bacterium]